MAIDYPPVFINNYLAEMVPDTLPEYFSGYGGSNFFGMRFFPTQPTSIDAFTEQFPESAEEPFAVYDRMFRMRRNAFPHKRTEQLLYYFYKTAGGIDALVETVQVVADLLDSGDESAEDLNKWIKSKHKIAPNPDLTICRGSYVTKKTVNVTSRFREAGVATLTTQESHGLKVGDWLVVSDVVSSLNGEYQVSDVPSLNKVSYNKSGIDILETSVSGGKLGLGYPTMKFFDKQFYLPYFHETKIYQLEEARDIIDFGTARTYAGNKVIIEYCWHKSVPR